MSHITIFKTRKRVNQDAGPCPDGRTNEIAAWYANAYQSILSETSGIYSYTVRNGEAEVTVGEYGVRLDRRVLQQLIDALDNQK